MGATLAEALMEDMRQWEPDIAATFHAMTGTADSQEAATAAQQCFTALFCSKGKICEAAGEDGDTGKNCFGYLRVLANFFSYAPLNDLIGWIARNAPACFRPDTRIGESPQYYGEDVPFKCTTLQGVYEMQPFIGPDGQCYRIRGNL